jgi:STE24 endopeptidase
MDPTAATAALIDSLGPETLARAARYTAGKEWLLLWNLVAGGVVAWLILRGPNLRAFAAGLVYFPAAWLIGLPWSIYTDWWRETSYGRKSQPFGDYLGQDLLSTAIFTVLGALFLVGVYALIRRTGAKWWLWAGALTAAATSAVMLAAPVFIEPLFNQFKPVPPGEVRTALEAMARQAGVPADRIFVFDGSRQSNNFTANVAGIGGTARIAISDVAFKGATLDEVKAVTAHEIGHYVSGDVWRGIALVSVLAMASFWLASRLHGRFARAFRSAAPLADPRGLPVVLFMVSAFMLLGLPVLNTFTRMSEARADRHSLETVNLPDGLATALVKTAEYRDPRPNPVQELLFYSHPSVERRVLAAMRWKAGDRAP